jgi:hypothetical protein
MAIASNITQFPGLTPIILHFILAGIVISAIAWVYKTLTANHPNPEFPIVDLKDEEGLSAESSWMLHGRRLLAKGLRLYPDRPFQIITGTGPKFVLPNRYADELKNNPHASFTEAFRPEFFVNYPGFGGLKDGLIHEGFIPEVIRTKLTQSLGLVTAGRSALSRDCARGRECLC